MGNWSSLRLRDGPIGVIGILLMALGITLVAVAARFGDRTFIYIVFLLFPPAIFGAIYSLFFERSKLLGSIAIFLAARASTNTNSPADSAAQCRRQLDSP